MSKKFLLLPCILLAELLAGCFYNGSRNKTPVKDPVDILSDFMSFWYYWNNEVKLSLDFTAYDENERPISKSIFLNELSSGNYLPLRLKSDDSGYIYELYKINSQEKNDISHTIAMYGKVYSHYLQMEGKPLPHFNFRDLNGNLYNNMTCKGKVVVLNCWFIGCQACREEMPALNQLVHFYKDRKDILFVSLSFNPPDLLTTFLAKNIFDYAIVPDMKHYLTDTLNLPAYPTHLILSKKGIVTNITNDYREMEIALRNVANKY